MAQLLTLSYLNDACFLSLNENDKKYQMCLKMAQEDLRDGILGREFYEQIESQYPAFTGASDNNTLYTNYLKDFLAWQTYFHYLKFANINATPTGIREFTDDNSSLASDVKMYALEKSVMSRANQYKFAAINFLKESQANDSTKYTLWEDTCREEFSFAITAVDKGSSALFKVNKTINTNE
jgi:hypothetical protein